MNYANKYAPTNLDDFIYPNDEVECVVRHWASGDVIQPLLLHGPNGTGKSQLSTLIPNAIEGGDAEISIVDASDLNNKDGLDLFVARTLNLHIFNHVMCYGVIEEYEQSLTTAPRIKTVLEKYQKLALFIITSNHPGKIDNGVKSRCKCLHVPGVTPDRFLPFASKVLTEEGVKYDIKTISNLLEDTYQSYGGDNRKYYEVLSDFLYQVKYKR